MEAVDVLRDHGDQAPPGLQLGEPGVGGVRLGVRVDEVRAVEREELRRLVHQAVVAEQVLGGATTRTLGRVEPGS